MALNKTQLKTDLLNALNAAADGKRKTLADSLADAIETYVKGATVTTTVTIPKITHSSHHRRDCHRSIRNWH